jgi:hypothetical protein
MVYVITLGSNQSPIASGGYKLRILCVFFRKSVHADKSSIIAKTMPNVSSLME